MKRQDNYVPAFNYDFLTPFYDFFVEILGYGKSQRVKVINLLALKARENLLDVGCGTGTLLILAKQRFPKVKMTGIDIDPRVLGIATKKTTKMGLDIEYFKTSAANMPFKDSTFDVVVSSLVFHHLPTEVKKQTIKEIHRVLKKEGRFLLADFGKKEGFTLLILDFITKFFRLPESSTLQDNIKGRLPEWLEHSGFKVGDIAKKSKGVQFLLGEKV